MFSTFLHHKFQQLFWQNLQFCFPFFDIYFSSFRFFQNIGPWPLLEYLIKNCWQILLAIEQFFNFLISQILAFLDKICFLSIFFENFVVFKVSQSEEPRNFLKGFKKSYGMISRCNRKSCKNFLASRILASFLTVFASVFSFLTIIVIIQVFEPQRLEHLLYSLIIGYWRVCVNHRSIFNCLVAEVLAIF